MNGNRLAGSLALCLLAVLSVAAPAAITAAPLDETAAAAPDDILFRVFLTDGRAVASYGEVARVDDRVIFSMPTSSSPLNPELQLVTIAADQIDWARTTSYAEAVRA